MFVGTMDENGYLRQLLTRCYLKMYESGTVKNYGDTHKTCTCCHEVWTDTETHAEGCLYSDLGDELRRTHDV
jgi:hypothetical protein